MANPSELCLVVVALVLHAPWSSLGLCVCNASVKGQGGTARHWHALLSPSQALLNLAGLQLFPNRTPARPWAVR